MLMISFDIAKIINICLITKYFSTFFMSIVFFSKNQLNAQKKSHILLGHGTWYLMDLSSLNAPFLESYHYAQ